MLGDDVDEKDDVWLVRRRWRMMRRRMLMWRMMLMRSTRVMTRMVRRWM